MKFRPVGAELFHANRRTDRHDEGLFSQYCEDAQKKKYPSLWTCVLPPHNMSSSKHTHTKTALLLLARKKKKPFPLKFLDAAQSIYSHNGSTLSTFYKAICARYSHVCYWNENKVLFSLFLYLRGTHKLLGWGGVTAHTTVYAGSGLEPMVVCTAVTCDTFFAKDQLHQHYQLNQH